MDSADYYDNYVDRQVQVGVNDRHRAIIRSLHEAGLRAGQRVLEIGCGIGTLTELLVDAVGSDGEVTALDLSPRSITVAQERIGNAANLELIAGDVLELEIPSSFDAVVLPDVIEHIPIASHPALFGRIATWLAPSGFVLLNYPNPHYLEWCREHTPEVLQLIDQPIHADRLLADAYPHGLYLDLLKTYSIWIHEGDYVVAVFRSTTGVATFTAIPDPPPPLPGRMVRRIRSILK